MAQQPARVNVAVDEGDRINILFANDRSFSLQRNGQSTGITGGVDTEIVLTGQGGGVVESNNRAYIPRLINHSSRPVEVKGSFLAMAESAQPFTVVTTPAELFRLTASNRTVVFMPSSLADNPEQGRRDHERRLPVGARSMRVGDYLVAVEAGAGSTAHVRFSQRNDTASPLMHLHGALNLEDSKTLYAIGAVKARNRVMSERRLSDERQLVDMVQMEMKQLHDTIGQKYFSSVRGEELFQHLIGRSTSLVNDNGIHDGEVNGYIKALEQIKELARIHGGNLPQTQGAVMGIEMIQQHITTMRNDLRKAKTDEAALLRRESPIVTTMNNVPTRAMQVAETARADLVKIIDSNLYRDFLNFHPKLKEAVVSARASAKVLAENRTINTQEKEKFHRSMNEALRLLNDFHNDPKIEAFETMKRNTGSLIEYLEHVKDGMNALPALSVSNPVDRAQSAVDDLRREGAIIAMDVPAQRDIRELALPAQLNQPRIRRA